MDLQRYLLHRNSSRASSIRGCPVSCCFLLSGSHALGGLFAVAAFVNFTPRLQRRSAELLAARPLRGYLAVEREWLAHPMPLSLQRRWSSLLARSLDGACCLCGACHHLACIAELQLLRRQSISHLARASLVVARCSPALSSPLEGWPAAPGSRFGRFPPEEAPAEAPIARRPAAPAA